DQYRRGPAGRYPRRRVGVASARRRRRRTASAAHRATQWGGWRLGQRPPHPRRWGARARPTAAGFRGGWRAGGRARTRKRGGAGRGGGNGKGEGGRGNAADDTPLLAAERGGDDSRERAGERGQDRAYGTPARTETERAETQD